MGIRRILVRILGALASSALILFGSAGICGFGDCVADATTEAPESPVFRCNNVLQKTLGQRFLMVVSTLDGYVTALNGQTGNVQWTLSTGSGPLLSSSITNLELMRDGAPSRLVPSLDGGLYHINEKGIEPVPLAADVMLSSSFRFADNSMIVGAKAIESYGINLDTGKVRYTCSSEGCKFFDDDKIKSDGLDEVLVISRNDKTVRAVEMHTGHEKWNFSVGQHDVTYLFNAGQEEPVKSIIEGSSINEDDDSEQCSVEADGFDEDAYRFKPSYVERDDFDPYDVKLKVLVTGGKIFAFSESQPGKIYWEHEFETAIASTWLLRDGKLSEVDLFNSEIVPVLGKSEGFAEFEVDGGKNTPVLYLGTYNKQLYVQPSVRFLAEVESATEDAVKKGSIVDINMPRVVWRPYLATAASRTPTVAPTQPHLQISAEDNWTQERDETSVVKWQDNYPFDGGYYLFPDYTPIQLLGEANRTTVKRTSRIISFLVATWMHVLIPLGFLVGVVIGTAIFVFQKLRIKAEQKRLKCLFESEVTPASTSNPVDDAAAPVSPPPVIQPEETPKLPADYISRYATDFQQEACLGRGGFGVVFKAINRLDDCVYAVKRIALHDSERAREKVMREVKALARLDHPGIVRYYQSWLESPPPGWQEEKDRALLDYSVATPSQDFVASDFNFSAQVNQTGASDDTSNCVCTKSSARSDDVKFSLNASLNCGSSMTADDLVSDDSLVKTWSHRTTSDDSVEISFRDDGSCKNGAIEDWSNCSDVQENGNLSAEDSDDVEIIFEKNDKSNVGENDIVTKSASSSVGSASKGEVSRLSPIPERPQSLRLPGQGASSCDRKSPSKTKKLYLYIQMQICLPQNLKDWLNDNVENRDKNRLLDIFHQIVRAISYVHKQGLMHRDLKPSNIFFDQNAMIKIGDFGLVTAAEEKCLDDGYGSNPSQGSKHTNQVGTTLYMSPEQSAGGNYTYKVDIYALGMIFFELFYPFHTNMERICTLQDIRQLRFPSDFISNSSQEHKFVCPLLSHDPDTRPSTQEILQNEILVELEEAAEALNRLHLQARQRTMSQSSGNSGSATSPVRTSFSEAL